jgi:hypothetical protein
METEKEWLRDNLGKTVEDWTIYIRRFYLSPKGARGILRRSEIDGRKEIPEMLRQVLERLAEDGGTEELEP